MSARWRPAHPIPQRRSRIALGWQLLSAVGSQAFLSAASFAVGLLLIRTGSDSEYAAYVIAIGVLALGVSLQNALLLPVLAVQLPRLAPGPRGELIGGLFVAQRRVLGWAVGSLLLLAGALAASGALDPGTALRLGAAALAAAALLMREYFRRVLFAHRRADRVGWLDLGYGALMVAGVAVAVRGPSPTAGALLATAAAAALSAALLARAARWHEPWQARSWTWTWTGTGSGPWRALAPAAAWASAGAAIHWTLSQGQVYLVAATLDVAAVAAIAATRTLLMPVNLLSTGIGTLMLPLAAAWLPQHGVALVRRRLSLLALAVAVASAAYVLLLWVGRDWLFTHVLRRQFAQRDTLLLLWAAIVGVTAVRDQLACLLCAQGRFRALTLLTLVCAGVALLFGWVALSQLGVAGALLGMLAGESLSLIGVGLLMRRRLAVETRPALHAPAVDAAVSPGLAAVVASPVAQGSGMV